MEYLIMKCEPLNDQYECDANRIPITIVKDWTIWVKKHPYVEYQYEVWQYDNMGNFTLIKEYDTPINNGMALYYWEANEDPEENTPHIITNFPNYTRKQKVPSIVYEYINKGAWNCYGEKGVDDWLLSSGNITWNNIEGRYYVYGEYRDNHYNLGY